MITRPKREPFPSDEAIKQAIEDIAAASPDLKLGDKEFMDISLLREIDKEGCFAAVQR